jgi:hypothetical protein
MGAEFDGPATATKTLSPPESADQAQRVRRSAEPVWHEHVESTRSGGLTVGAADDPEERDADRVADLVIARMAAGSSGSGSSGSGASGSGSASDGSGDSSVRREFSGSGDPIVGMAGGSAGDDVSHAIESRRGSGTRLPAPLRERFESAMGADLSAIRIHTDTNAARISRSISAKAFTTGNDIFFGAGAYAPTTQSGTHTLAHELAHTQQNGGSVARQIRRDPGDVATPEAPAAPRVHKKPPPLPPTTPPPGSAPSSGAPSPSMATPSKPVPRPPSTPPPPGLAPAKKTPPPLPSGGGAGPTPPTGPPPSGPPKHRRSAPVDPGMAPLTATPDPVTPVLSPPPEAPAAPVKVIPATAEQARAARALAVSKNGLFVDVIAAAQKKLAPEAIIASAASSLQLVAAKAATDVSETTVKAAVVGAAIQRIGEKTLGAKIKGAVKDSDEYKLALFAVAPIVQDRINDLDALEGRTAVNAGFDALSGSDQLGKLAEIMKELNTTGKVSDDLNGKRVYLSAQEKARITRARGALQDSKGAPSSDALKAAASKMVATLMDAELRSRVEGDAELTKFYTATASQLMPIALTALKASNVVVGTMTAELTAQLGEWVEQMRVAQDEVTAGSGLSKEDLDSKLAGMDTLSDKAFTTSESISRNAGPLLLVSPGVEKVAFNAANNGAGPISATAVEAVRKYISKNKTNYTTIRDQTNRAVKGQLTSMADKAKTPGSVRTPEEQALYDKVAAEVGKTADGATSNLRYVGEVLDLAIGSKNKAGQSTSLEITVKIPVAGYPGATVNIRMKLEAAQTFANEEEKPETTVNAELALGIEGKLPFAASACLELGGYMKGTGRTAVDAMEFISYALYRRFRESSAIPRQITNAMWGAGGVTAAKGEDSGAAEYAEAEAWGTGMEERMSATGGSAETGALVGASAEIGMQKGEAMGSAGFGAKAKIMGSMGTKYDKSSIESGRAEGGGKATKSGAQKSIGQGRRAISVTGSAASIFVGGDGAGTMGWGQDAEGNYQFDNMDIRLTALAQAPKTKTAFGTDRESVQAIMNWVAQLFSGMRGLKQKLAAAEQTTLTGEMAGHTKTLATKPFVSLAADIGTEPHVSYVVGGWLYAAGDGVTSGVHAGAEATGDALSSVAGPLTGALTGSGSRGGVASDVTGAIKSGAKTAGDGIVKGGQAVTSGVRTGVDAVSGVASTVTDALNLASQGAVHLTGHYAMNRSGGETVHTLDFSFGLQSDMSIDVYGVKVAYASTNNFVTIMLLPKRAYLA